MCDLLGFGEDVYAGVRLVVAKWCAEPSVHGGKAIVPKSPFSLDGGRWGWG